MFNEEKIKSSTSPYWRVGMERIDDDLALHSDVTVSTTVTPQAEYKGFAAHVVSVVALSAWFIWAITPDKLLNAVGIWYYPSRWWALSIPAWVLVAMGFGYSSLALVNSEIVTLELDDLRCVVDDTGVIVTQLGDELYLNTPTNGVWDIPLSEVNRVLYSS